MYNLYVVILATIGVVGIVMVTPRTAENKVVNANSIFQNEIKINDDWKYVKDKFNNCYLLGYDDSNGRVLVNIDCDKSPFTK